MLFHVKLVCVCFESIVTLTNNNQNDSRRSFKSISTSMHKRATASVR
jgi:hypothetical protein